MEAQADLMNQEAMEWNMYFIFIEAPKTVLLFNAKHNAPPKGRIPWNIRETVRITIPRKLHPPVNNVHTGTVPLRRVSQSTDVHVNPQASSDIFRDGGSNKIKSQVRFEAGDRNQSRVIADGTPITQGAKQIDR